MKDSSLFEKLVRLRNDARPDEEGTGAPEDLGLDEEVEEHTNNKKRQREERGPTSIVELHHGGQSFCVLSGRGREPVCMEATSENMRALHHMVSTEVSAGRSERPGLEAASEAPNDDALEPGLLAAQESDSSDAAPSTPDPQPSIEQQSSEQPGFDQVRGITWVPKRRAWILRYTDDRGKKRQKSFAAKECTRAGQAQALRWLEEYKEGCNEALDV